MNFSESMSEENEPPTFHVVPPLDLDRIVESVQSGNVRDFEKLVKAFQWQIRSYLHVRCPIHSDPDDITQEVFIVAYRKIQLFEVGTNFRAWLFSIARYQLLSEIQKQKRRSAFCRAYEGDPTVGQREPLLEDPHDDLMVAKLQECISQLNEKGREALRLRYTNRKSIREIAKLRERSEGAVKKQLHVIRKKLEDCLTESTEGIS